jgi:hypothetical protein
MTVELRPENKVAGVQHAVMDDMDSDPQRAAVAEDFDFQLLIGSEIDVAEHRNAGDGDVPQQADPERLARVVDQSAHGLACRLAPRG